MVHYKFLFFFSILSFVYGGAAAQPSPKAIIVLDDNIRYQTISNFAASDAWACQFVGNWPDEKKQVIADWLFSQDTLANGNPKGIGLSMWRYNLGAGSMEQQEQSGIADEWRRASLTTSHSANVQGQNWFLQAAQKRGVRQFLGFFNSPPASLTRNGKAYADSGRYNIDSNRYKEFAGYTVKAMREIERSTGILFGFLSPVNEPQWDWSDGGQEGCPYNNAAISSLVRAFSKVFQQSGLPVKLLVPESGHIKYLLSDDDKPGKGMQIYNFFNPASPNYIAELPNVSNILAAHSYFSTSPFQNAVSIRNKVKESIAQLPGLQLWQSEYCILGDNDGEINGNGRDLGMDAGLYVAKVIYEDLVLANAAAWQWWTAISPYNYKDGLVYISKSKTDGSFSDSKILWALGNYSFFVRPGMHRIEATTTANDLLVSAFKGDGDKTVLIVVNPSVEQRAVSIEKGKAALPARKLLTTYTTDASHNLNMNRVWANEVVVPGKSVVSVIVE